MEKTFQSQQLKLGPNRTVIPTTAGNLQQNRSKRKESKSEVSDGIITDLKELNQHNKKVDQSISKVKLEKLKY